MANILLVVDPQNDFITGALGSEHAQSIVPKIVEKINNFVGTICVTNDEHYDDYLNTREGAFIPVHCVAETQGSEINLEIKNSLTNRGDFFVLKKENFSLKEFYLDWIVRNLNDEDDAIDCGTIEIVGYATDICVVTNALAFNRYKCKVVVDASCCAGTSKEAHEAALTVMRSCLIEVQNA